MPSYELYKHKSSVFLLHPRKRFTYHLAIPSSYLVLQQANDNVQHLCKESTNKLLRHLQRYKPPTTNALPFLNPFAILSLILKYDAQMMSLATNLLGAAVLLIHSSINSSVGGASDDLSMPWLILSLSASLI